MENMHACYQHMVKVPTKVVSKSEKVKTFFLPNQREFCLMLNVEGYQLHTRRDSRCYDKGPRAQDLWLL